MEGKYFVVVVVPKDDQNYLIEINKYDMYSDWHEATEAFSTVAEHIGATLPKIPKNAQPLSTETDTLIIQIWICQLTITN